MRGAPEAAGAKQAPPQQPQPPTTKRAEDGAGAMFAAGGPLSSSADKAHLRLVVNSNTWNALIVGMMAVDLAFLPTNGVSSTTSLSVLVDVALVVLFGSEAVMRFLVYNHGSFFKVTRNRVTILLLLIALANLILHVVSGMEVHLLEGVQVGVMMVRMLWCLPHTHAPRPKPKDLRDNSDSRSSRCIHILQSLRDKLNSGLDGEAGMKVERLDYVINTIRGDQLYANHFDNLLEETDIDREQGVFLRMFFSDESFTHANKKEQPHPALLVRENSKLGAANGSGDAAGAVLAMTGEWDFDVFLARDVSHNKPLSLVGPHIFRRLNLTTTFRISHDCLVKFFDAVEKNYQDNPYHNATHACDVTQALFFQLVSCGLTQCLSPLEVLGCLLSAVLHDVGHIGVTNNFLKQTYHELALRYNDHSILENLHASLGWSLCTHPDHDLFANLTSDQRREVRELMIDMVLDTDMARHSKVTAKFQNRLADGFKMDDAGDRRMVLSMLLHVSDLANCARKSKLAERWGSMVMTEFFNQGDREQALGLPITPNMDRAGGPQLVAKCQMTFLEYVVTPLYKEWCGFLRQYARTHQVPAAERGAQLFEDHLANNIEHWQRIFLQLSPTEVRREFWDKRTFRPPRAAQPAGRLRSMEEGGQLPIPRPKPRRSDTMPNIRRRAVRE